jgi:hypothetical protein
MGPTPLLDFFKRGEAERDVKLQAAQGTLAPRAHEQLAILVLLLEDPDREIRETADDTLNKIPLEALEKFLASPDVPVDLREFFCDRGIFPADIPPIELDFDDPLIEIGEGDDDEVRLSGTQELAAMSFPQRLKCAIKGTREQRSILIRDPNKLICASVLSSPKVSVPEVESFAKMQNVSEDVLRIIGHNRAWLKSYGVILALTKNPKTPLALSMQLMNRLTTKDLAKLSVDRNVPEALRIQSRKKVVSNQSGKE